MGLAVVGLGLAFPCLAWDRHHDTAFKVARGHFDYELTRDYATARSSLMSTLDQG